MVASFSCLMSVYSKENPKNLYKSLQSILNQSLLPNEFVLVKDGPVSDKLDMIILQFVKKANFPVMVVGTEQNHGLGSALNYGLQYCSCEYVARVDSDDLNIEDRFEKEMMFLEAHPKVDVVGGQIQEFIEADNKIIKKGIRKVPTSASDIIRFAGKRNPLNHMTVMFKRKKVIEVGMYRNIIGFEDYDLWLRLLKQKCTISNLDSILVYARTDNGFEKRRGGVAYFGRALRARSVFLINGSISPCSYIIALLAQGISSALPTGARRFIYNRILRKN